MTDHVKTDFKSKIDIAKNPTPRKKTWQMYALWILKKNLKKKKLTNAIHWKQNTLKDCEMRSICAISIKY